MLRNGKCDPFNGNYSWQWKISGFGAPLPPKISNHLVLTASLEDFGFLCIPLPPKFSNQDCLMIVLGAHYLVGGAILDNDVIGGYVN
jgi:hypothetical protein